MTVDSFQVRLVLSTPEPVFHQHAISQVWLNQTLSWLARFSLQAFPVCPSLLLPAEISTELGGFTQGCSTLS